MLLKLTTGVNFTNILLQAFSNQSGFFATFMILQLGFVSFCVKIISKKTGHKVLVKLTIGLWRSRQPSAYRIRRLASAKRKKKYNKSIHNRKGNCMQLKKINNFELTQKIKKFWLIKVINLSSANLTMTLREKI
jgi:hypothetical protein